MENEIPDYLVAVVPKNKRETVHVTLRKFQGRDLLDVRVYVDGVVGPQPTGKGVSLSVERLPELRAALEQAELEAVSRGLLTSLAVA